MTFHTCITPRGGRVHLEDGTGDKTLCGRVDWIGGGDKWDGRANVCGNCFRVASKADFVLPQQERDERNRYLIYRLPNGSDELQLVGTTDTKQGAGLALITYGEEGEFERSVPGLMDAAGTDGTYETGTWLINPWEGRAK